MTSNPSSYKVGVKTNPKEDWAYNDLRFPNVEMATAYARDLEFRWTSVCAWEVQPSDDPVLYFDGNHKRITEEGASSGDHTTAG